MTISSAWAANRLNRRSESVNGGLSKRHFAAPIAANSKSGSKSSAARFIASFMPSNLAPPVLAATN